MSDIESEDVLIEEAIHNSNPNSSSPNIISNLAPAIEIRKFVVIKWKIKNKDPLKLIILNKFGDPCNSSLQELLDQLNAYRQQQEHEEQILVRKHD